MGFIERGVVMTNELKKAVIDFEETLNNTLGLTPNQVINIQASVMKIVDVIEKELKEREQLKEMYNHALEVHSKLSESIVKYKKKDKALEMIIKNCSFDLLEWAKNYDDANNTNYYDLLKEVLL